MIVLPENAGEQPGGEVEVALLPRKEEHAIASRLARRGLRRPILFGVIAACGLAAVFAAVGLLNLLEPASSFTEMATSAFAVAVVLLLVALPLTAVLALLVVWFLFGRRGRSAPGFDLTRSVLAVTAGVATVAIAGFVLLSLRSTLDAALPLAVNWSLSIACEVLAGLGAGWVTVRLSPIAPYRHAIGVGIVIVLGLALLLPDPYGTPWLALTAAVCLAYVSVFLGAWIGVRFGYPPAGPREAG
jgi:hypothetical protein